MKLSDLPTPCLVLDRRILARNIERMSQAVGRLGVGLRPHLKTAKSIDVARMVLASPHAPLTGITVSTLAEAEYFSAHGITDILYAVGITPQKLDQVAKLIAAGAKVTVITDDVDVAQAIAAHPAGIQALIEIDCGEQRGGMLPDAPELEAVAAALGPRLAGIMTHAGHSYSGRSIPEMADIAETERQAALAAVRRLSAAGMACPVVSVGSSPTALHARALGGVTETRPGVYMFGDLFQAEIQTVEPEAIAVTVLASVIGRRLASSDTAERRIVLDAGGMALSKDRATESAPHDFKFGLVLDTLGRRSYGHSLVVRANQEHGVVALDPVVTQDFRIGDRVRVAPNHTCMTSAAHDRYFVVDGGDEVVAVWPRINGW